MSVCCSICGDKDYVVYINDEPFCLEHAPDAKVDDQEDRITALEERVAQLEESLSEHMYGPSAGDE